MEKIGIQELLTDLGLTPHEIRIYQMLLNDGASYVGEISKKTGIHRRNIYDCLARLSHKGLVGYIKENNRKKCSISNPENILEALTRRRNECEKVLPQLLQQYQATHEHAETLFFRGRNGLKFVFEDQLNAGKEILVVATKEKVTQILTHFFEKYQMLRIEKKIPTRMLFDTEYQNNEKSASYLKNLSLCRVNYVQNFNTSPLSQYIYGDTVALVVWSHDPVAILIRQKEIAQGFREGFEFMWQHAEG